LGTQKKKRTGEGFGEGDRTKEKPVKKKRGGTEEASKFKGPAL